MILKNWEINEMEEITSVTPTPGTHSSFSSQWHWLTHWGWEKNGQCVADGMYKIMIIGLKCDNGSFIDQMWYPWLSARLQ